MCHGWGADFGLFRSPSIAACRKAFTNAVDTVPRRRPERTRYTPARSGRAHARWLRPLSIGGQPRRRVAPMSLVDFVALSLLPIRRWRPVAEEIRAGRSPRQILDLQLATLAADPGPRPRRGNAASMRLQAAARIERAQEAGLEAITCADAAYPAALAAIIDPPLVLWVRGAPAALDGPGVAIVGSRAGSPYVLAVADRLAADLAARGLTIVSGLARGIDSAAHRGALSAGGVTVAVLGCGADVVYPPEHGPLAGQIAARGAVISELVPGTPPQSWFFPLRNRIISGLCRATVVIEAGEKSGSLITARCALDQGRDVLAVPGNILNGRNRGGHALLRDGAKIVETADDIVEELGLTDAVVARRSNNEAAAPGGDSPARLRTDPVLGVLGAGESCNLDEISVRTGLPAARLLPRLFELELRGLVKRVGGGQFVRFDRSC
ncbi:MAG: DNA-protecting protein DprA [Luteitalea sp.]|nr:DNA-protecting protein DprA [Luteitalea sp.]